MNLSKQLAVRLKEVILDGKWELIQISKTN